jgi:hypothetical protein
MSMMTKKKNMVATIASSYALLPIKDDVNDDGVVKLRISIAKRSMGKLAVSCCNGALR